MRKLEELLRFMHENSIAEGSFMLNSKSVKFTPALHCLTPVLRFMRKYSQKNTYFDKCISRILFLKLGHFFLNQRYFIFVYGYMLHATCTLFSMKYRSKYCYLLYRFIIFFIRFIHNAKYENNTYDCEKSV